MFGSWWVVVGGDGMVAQSGGGPFMIGNPGFEGTGVCLLEANDVGGS